MNKKEKTSEYEMTGTEDMYRSLFELANDAIFINSLDGMFLDINSVACDRLGYSREELLKMRLTDIDTPEYAAMVEKRIRELRSSGQLVLETVHRARDGREIPAEVSCRIIQYRNQPAFLSIARDITLRKNAQIALQRANDELEARVERRTAALQKEITQRKEIEEKLRRSEVKYRDLVESANTIILEFDLEGKITFFNRFALEFFGYREEEILGQNIVGTIVPEFDSKGVDLKLIMADLVKNPELYYNSENENMRSNGERVWIAWTNKEIYDDRGKLSKILSIGIDRTEQTMTAELLAVQSRESAAAAERTRLARDLHDAVSQTLFSASIIAEVLPQIWEKNIEEGRRRLEEVRLLTRGALAEMRTLLFELRPSALADAELGYLLHQLAESITGRTRIPVEVIVTGQCDVSAEIKVAFYRITQEALNNVVKHAGAGKITISLICEPGSIELSISDNGRGFEQSAVQPESLGLNIMRDRAEGVNAEFSVKSTPGSGTQVIVRLNNFTGR